MLNMSKTSIINSSRINSIFPSVIVDGQIISPINSVQNLGFIFDSKLIFIDQISSVCRSSFFNLHKIKTITNFLPDNICNLLIESTVISRIEYCNSLYHGLPLYSINYKIELYGLQYAYYFAYNYLITIALPKHYMA